MIHRIHVLKAATDTLIGLISFTRNLRSDSTDLSPERFFSCRECLMIVLYLDKKDRPWHPNLYAYMHFYQVSKLIL